VNDRISDACQLGLTYKCSPLEFFELPTSVVELIKLHTEAKLQGMMTAEIRDP
jgi:hypothetical protein